MPEIDYIPALYASLIVDAFEGGDWRLAKQTWLEADMDGPQRLECWGFLVEYPGWRAYLSDAPRVGLQEIYQEDLDREVRALIDAQS